MKTGTIVAILVAAALCWRGRADACGASPPAYWTLTSAVPSDLQQPMPTDGAIVLLAKPWTDIYPDRSGNELLSQIEVTVRDAAGAVVEGLVEAWYGTAGAAVSWRPRLPMSPNSSFSLQAATNSTAVRPAAATGETTLAVTFATGSSVAPPLHLQGSLQAHLETYDLVLWKDCNDCGTGCTANGSVRSLRARVTIPAVEGGYTHEGYAAWLWITNDQPHELPDGRGGTLVNLGGIQRIATNGTTDVLVSVPSENEPYAPCFALRVYDPAGHFVDAPPLCLARQDINTTIRDLDAAIVDAGTDHDGGSDGNAALVVDAGIGSDGRVASTHPATANSAGSGCALISGESDLGFATLLAWLATCATALTSGRSRRRSGTRRQKAP